MNEADRLVNAVKKRVRLAEEAAAREAEKQRIRLAEEAATREAEKQRILLAEEAVARAAEEQRIRLAEEAAAREAEQQRILKKIIIHTKIELTKFFTYIVPKVADHFESSSEPMKVSSLIPANNLDGLMIFREGLQSAGNFTIYDRDDDARGEFYVHGPNRRLDLGENDSLPMDDIMHPELKLALTRPNNYRIRVEYVFEDWVIFQFNRKRKRRHFVIARFVDGEFRLQLASDENGVDLDIRPWGENIAVMNQSRIIYYTLGGDFHAYNTPRGVLGTNPTNIFPIVEERGWVGHWERTFYKVAFFPDLSNEIMKSCLREFFEQYGLSFEVTDKESFKLTISI